MRQHVISTCAMTICLVASIAFSQAPSGLEGKWEGTLTNGPNQLRMILNFTGNLC